MSEWDLCAESHITVVFLTMPQRSNTSSHESTWLTKSRLILERIKMMSFHSIPFSATCGIHFKCFYSLPKISKQFSIISDKGLIKIRLLQNFFKPKKIFVRGDNRGEL